MTLKETCIVLALSAQHTMYKLCLRYQLQYGFAGGMYDEVTGGKW